MRYGILTCYLPWWFFFANNDSYNLGVVQIDSHSTTPSVAQVLVAFLVLAMNGSSQIRPFHFLIEVEGELAVPGPGAGPPGMAQEPEEAQTGRVGWGGGAARPSVLKGPGGPFLAASREVERSRSRLSLDTNGPLGDVANSTGSQLQLL